MFWHGMARSGRTLIASAAMLLFLGGSNYCLLSVLAGGSMSCLTAPGASTSGTSHCGHALPASATGDESPAADSSPCCVTAALVAGCQVHKADAGEAFAALAIIEPVVASSVGATRFGSIPDNKPPPELPRAARHSGRAPPLA